VIGGGKDGFLYLLNREAMGGLDPSNSSAWQRINFGSPIFATGAFWNGTFFLAGVGGPLQSYSIDTATGMFSPSGVPQSSGTFGFPGSTPSVSSSGTVNGIVWALDNGSFCTPGPNSGCGPAVLTRNRECCRKCGEIYSANRRQWQGVRRDAGQQYRRRYILQHHPG
jgi:hypothetical protein